MRSEFAWRSVPLILGGLLGLSLLWFYWPVLTDLFTQLSTDEDFSFGLLLPIVSGYIVYLKWPQVSRVSWQPSWKGLALIGLGLIFFVFGKLAADVHAPRYSFLTMLVGVVVLLGGIPLLRLMAFPFLLLFFMLPLPTTIVSAVTLPLQLLSSHLAAFFLQVLGVPLMRQGNIIDLGVRQLQVVAACSGLRYLLALIALGLIFCYFYQRRPWKAALLIISLVPTAIIANAFRVAAMGIFPALQEGFWHGFSGWLIFIFSLGILMLFNSLLNYLKPPLNPTLEERAKAPDIKSRPSLTPYLLSALAMIIVLIPLSLKLGQSTPLKLLQSFDTFPEQLGAWRLIQRSYMDQEILVRTGAHNYFNADFAINSGNRQQDPVSLYIAYYETSVLTGLAHTPKNCMVAGGWKVIQSGVKEIAGNRPINFLLMEKDSAQILVYYWHLQQGQWMRNERLYKFYMVLNGMFHKRTDWALIRLITPVSGASTAAAERLTNFARLLVPVLPQFISGQ